MRDRAAELVFGTVQLGLPYGIANRTGKPSREDAVALVHLALENEVRTFDTARAYGDSEDVLGAALKGRARIVTKLGPLADLVASATRDEVRSTVDRSISESLSALRHGRLDCLLLHRAEHLTAFRGFVWERLKELAADGTIGTLGVSVQSRSEAHAALMRPEVRHIQLPFNLLDWRWKASGVIDRIRERPDVTMHLRSVFLQGLLCSGDATLWPPMPAVDPVSVITCLHAFVRTFRRSGLADLCVAYARAQVWANGIVIGMETEEQLHANVSLFGRTPLTADQCAEIECCLPRVPVELLNPARWPKREHRHAA